MFLGLLNSTAQTGFQLMIHGWLRSFWRLEDDFKPMIFGCFDLGGVPPTGKNLAQYKPIGVAHPRALLNNWNGLKLSLALGYGTGEAEGRRRMISSHQGRGTER